MVSYDDDMMEKINFMVDIGVVISEFFVIIEVVEIVKFCGLMIVMGVLNVMCGMSYFGNFFVCEVYVVGFLDILVVDYYFVVILFVICVFVLVDFEGLVGVVRFVFLNLVKVFGFIDCGEIVIGKWVDVLVIDSFD